MSCISVFHKFVYRRVVPLTSGHIVHFRTTNLRNVYFLQSAGADPVMYIVDGNNNVVAFNDDYTGFASEIIFTPGVTGPYTLIIRAYSTKTPGYCNLERGDDGAPPTLLDRDVLFFGVRVDAQWNQGDVFETSNSTGDPYLFLITGNKMYWDDDSGPGVNSRFVAPAAGSGIIVLGSWSRWLEGGCDLCLTSSQGPSSLSAHLSPRPSAFERKDTPMSREMKKFILELQGSKQALEKLDPGERDKKVMELQQRILSEEERRLQVSPMPQADADFVRCQENYMERYKELENDLEKLSYAERSERLAELKRRMMGP